MSRYEPTPALLLAVRRASAWARRAGSERIEAVHLLHGILAEEEGMAAGLLQSTGADLERIRAELQLTGPLPAADAEPLPLGDPVQAALRRGRDLAAAHSEEWSITSDQALLALLEQDTSLRQRLEAHGLDFARLAARVDPPLAPIQLEVPLFGYEPPEPIDIARILDAAANRAREGLRVLEDYARFVLDDKFLSRELKEMRHALADALVALPADLLLQARDTLRDVGTGATTPQEAERLSLASVVIANAKRLQEALRTLEEYGKVYDENLGSRIEAVRYRSYTVEKALLLGRGARDRLAGARLYVLVTEASCRLSLVGTVKEALLGGADIIQLREKTLNDAALLAQAREVRRLTRAAGALFIMNDRPDLALLAEADGVHLGQDDLPVREARRIVGPEALVGVSTHNLEQVRRAVLDGASYLGVGPTFPSQTKDFAALSGLDFVRQAFAETTLPAFALGGINIDNVADVIAAGARGIAVSHAVCAAPSAQQAARALRASFTPGPAA